jgi:hypothetical protein
MGLTSLFMMIMGLHMIYWNSYNMFSDQGKLKKLLINSVVTYYTFLGCYVLFNRKIINMDFKSVWNMVA